MKLLKLHVENFGTLHDFSLELSDGLQVFHHENGWGKSTLAVFIKAIFFGLPATSKRSLDENERKKYMPWQGGAFGGSIEFESAKGRFRAERFFAAKESGDSFALYDLATQSPSNAYTAALGVELFGVDAEGFERSTYFSQRVLDTKNGNAEISARLGNLLDDVDDMSNFEVAKDLLEKRSRHYVTTGNRGAIALTEKEILEKQRELELCESKQEAKQAQEKELAELNEQLAAVQKLVSENRAGMQKAALAREHAALLERKNSMLNEISELSQQKKVLRDFFGGFPPSSQELEHQLGLYEQIKETNTRLKTLSEPPAEPEKREYLRRVYPAGVPSEADLERLSQENEELRYVSSRIDALQQVKGEETLDKRFENGVPSAARIEAANASLAQADALQRDLDQLRQKQNAGAFKIPFLPLSVLFFVLGGVLLTLFFLPATESFGISLPIAGGVCLAIALLLLVVSLIKHGKTRKAAAEDAANLNAWEAQRNKNLQSVRTLLAEYGMPEQNLTASLAELALLADQSRERMHRQNALAEETKGLQKRLLALRESIHSYVSRIFRGLENKNDYGAEIDRLCRDAEMQARFIAEDRKRQYDRAVAEEALDELNNQFIPFLRRYDAKGALPAGECLDLIEEKREEYNRVCKEITRREGDLRAFVEQKKLDEISPDEPGLYERLTDEENELQERFADLQKRKTVMQNSIDRLTAETDRIPELVAQLNQLKEKLAVSKANYDTVTKTLALLEESKTALSTRYLNGMKESFDRFLKMLVGENAPEAMMDESFEIRMNGGGQTRTMESFSRGWRDAVQFCVRLSLTEALYTEGEKPFLLLDDPFVNLDDRRLAAARAMLDSLASEYQIIYMVCHEERK